MDEQRFDELSKKLATSVSRRQALRIMGTTAVGGLGALFGARGAFAHHNAQCRDVGDNCRSNAECCDRVCLDFHCVCPGGTVLCPGTNECLPECSGPRVFNPDTCQCECPEGTSACGEFSCCAPDSPCCGSTFCCPPQTTCCVGSGFLTCCPPGYTCNQQQGCLPAFCQTPGQSCFVTSQCGQGCTCVGATFFSPGICQ
jgi:hypothetical protein